MQSLKPIIIFFLIFLSFDILKARDNSSYKHAVDTEKKESLKIIQLLKESNWSENGGLEILVGGPSYQKTQSAFGHIALRFVNSGENFKSDWTLESLALIPQDEISVKTIFKGTIGSYTIIPRMFRLTQFIRDFILKEQRGISRIVIPSTPFLRWSLLTHLDLILRTNTETRYTFFGQNCVSFTLNILKISGFLIKNISGLIMPKEVSGILKQSLLSPLPELQVLSLDDITNTTKEYTKNEDLSSLSTLELQRNLVLYPYHSYEHLKKVSTELQSRQNLLSAEQVYGFINLPKLVYNIQVSKNWIPLTQSFYSMYTIEELDRAALQDYAAIKQNSGLNYCEDNQDQCLNFIAYQNQIFSELQRIHFVKPYYVIQSKISRQ